MSHNDFTDTPSVLAACPKLQTIGIASCKISTIRGLPPTLEALILTNNCIEELPDSIGSLTALRKLTLTGNRLHELPPGLLRCSNLELIRIAANAFTSLPGWAFELPNLAWYANAGNPGSPARHSTGQTIDWADLIIGKKLGESSKNAVYEATVRSSDQEVAVKVFGGQLSADGYSDDEINACLAMPSHSALIRTIAQVSGAPDDKRRLVMDRIPSSYMSLGKPPSLKTVTRDTYESSSAFAPSFILSVLHDIASALEHMHEKSIMHGDMYAHNILVNEQGNAFLADLGAASFYERTANNRHELIEVKAFGYLMSELLAQRQSDTDDKASDWALLEDLTTKCLLESPDDRPTFTEISIAIASLPPREELDTASVDHTT
jgi:Leucine-rich repeat (LRR) protein